MSLAPLKTTTALVASLSLLLPHSALVAPAWAQEVELLCLDESQPPCAEGEPSKGTSPAGRAALLADDAARQASEAEQVAKLLAEAVDAASAEALRLQQIAAEAGAADADEAAQAQAEADAATAKAARLAAEAEAAQLSALEATAAADVARDAAEQLAVAEAARQAAEESAATAEAEAQAAAAAEAEAARLAEEELAAAAEAEAQANAAAEAEAARLAEEKSAAMAEAEAQAAAAAEAEAARLAEEKSAAVAEAEALTKAAAEVEAVRLAEAEARLIAIAEAEAARLAEEKSAAVAEAEALAIAAAEVEAARLAEEEAAAAAEAEAQATAAAEAEAARLAEEELAAAAEAEAQAIAAAEAEAEAEAEAARLAEEKATAAAVAEAQAIAAAEAEAEAARLAEEEATAAAVAEAQAIAAAAAAEAEAARLAEEEAAGAAVASVTAPLVDPTTSEDYDVPAAAAPRTAAASLDVIEESLDTRSVRTSAQEFTTTIDGSTARAAQDSGMTNFEKAILLGLGAVAIGSVLRSGEQVVANSGDRLVVEGSGGLAVYKDDDALLRQPGATMRTETFTDGSSRVTLDREDGSQVVTIRDARGRVLRRTVLSYDGTRYELFDDLQPEPAVNLPQLDATRPEPRSFSAAESDLTALRTALRQKTAVDSERTFSLRQIREIEQVRNLVPAIELDTVTFSSNSAAIPPAQVRKLLRLGILIEELLLENPREMFLIEGHTDGVGSDSHNLALSDRRAESVALALSENFYIPPENLIVQGYGEAFPKSRTQTTDARNRRVAVRRITPLLRQIAEN